MHQLPVNKRCQPWTDFISSCQQPPDRNTQIKALSCGHQPGEHLLVSLCPKHIVTLAAACGVCLLFPTNRCCVSFPRQIRVNTTLTKLAELDSLSQSMWMGSARTGRTGLSRNMYQNMDWLLEVFDLISQVHSNLVYCDYTWTRTSLS